MNIDAVFKALADPGRRRLLDLLHEESGQSLNDLCEQMEMTRQGVTQHLSVLEQANLVAIVWRGREKLHYLNPVPLQEIYDRWIEKFERGRLKALRDLKPAARAKAMRIQTRPGMERTMSKPKFVYVTYIATTAENVWRALTDGDITRRYWGGVTPGSRAWENVSDWKPGSRWHQRQVDDKMTIGVVGEVIESEPPHRLVLSWARPSNLDRSELTSRVTFEVEPQANGVVKLT